MGEMHGARRVITFCILTAVLPTILLIIPLYLRHSLYADVSYEVAESDVVEVIDGISSLFCQEQILRMNSTFRAFQLAQMPPLSHHKQHIKLRKSMVLPDDTVEYWGFYLLGGSEVKLLACSRYDGAGVIVVKGDKTLKTCSIMEPQKKHVKYQKSQNSLNFPKKLPSKEVTQNNINEKPATQTTLPAEMISQIIPTEVPKRNSESKRISPDIDKITKEIKEYITNYNSSVKMNKNVTGQPKSGKELKYLNNQLRSQNLKPINKSEAEKHETSSDKNINYTESLEQRRTADELFEELSLNDGGDSFQEGVTRQKRKVNTFGVILDGGVAHGGNANITELPELESSDSSFENSLHECYEGDELLCKDINITLHCQSDYSFYHNSSSYKTQFLVDNIQIKSDGYYYFIFYSDNDHHLNPVHAEFNLFKTTYEHTNYTRGCINETECRFPISFGGKEIVIVEVPTRDGIEHEDGDTSILISSCYPRMSVYAIFPVAVLFLILGCAFL